MCSTRMNADVPRFRQFSRMLRELVSRRLLLPLLRRFRWWWGRSVEQVELRNEWCSPGANRWRHRLARLPGQPRLHRRRSGNLWRIRVDQLFPGRSEEHTSELQSQSNLVCRLLLEKKKKKKKQ